jgi:hypothetical protein
MHAQQVGQISGVAFVFSELENDLGWERPWLARRSLGWFGWLGGVVLLRPYDPTRHLKNQTTASSV